MKKVLKIIAVVFGALIIAAAIYLIIPKSYVTLSIAPSTATLTIDGGKPRQARTGAVILVSAGKHTYVFSRDGFASSTVTLTAGNNESKEILLGLTPKTDAARAILENDTQASLDVQQRLAGIAENNFVESADKTYPILAELPITLHSIAIYACKSQLYPDDANKIALCVYSYDIAAAKDQAPNVLREKGYNPDNYELIYEDPSDTPTYVPST